MTTEIDITRAAFYAKQAFFELLLTGYASAVKPQRITRFKGDPGTKRNISGSTNGWHGIDEWRTTSLGDGSNGTTSIYHFERLVWEMQYGGSYPEEAIPFLREALHVNYSAGIWLGGRGPAEYENESYRYTNETEDGDDFDDFSGVEFIDKKVDGKWTPVGMHKYRGGFLFTDR